MALAFDLRRQRLVANIELRNALHGLHATSYVPHVLRALKSLCVVQGSVGSRKR